MLTGNRVREITLSLLRQESDRDRQKKIGASDISDPCAFHLAKKLMNEPDVPSKYWLSAKIGTAIHSLLEDAIEVVDFSEVPELEGALVEKKITLGELEGYGAISSKPDLAIIKGSHLIDWKSSSRDKTRKMQKAIFGESKDASVIYSLKKYYAQTQLYSMGLNKQGTEIDGCSLVFINRDGTTENDIWEYTFPYDESYAIASWQRLESIWLALQTNKDYNQFEREADCFKCKVTDPA